MFLLGLYLHFQPKKNKIQRQSVDFFLEYFSLEKETSLTSLELKRKVVFNFLNKLSIYDLDRTGTGKFLPPEMTNAEIRKIHVSSLMKVMTDERLEKKDVLELAKFVFSLLYSKVEVNYKFQSDEQIHKKLRQNKEIGEIVSEVYDRIK
tara:strand:- start:1274 stop:1720 length:447 start_codon:yes stop_codon:yes gene_type:complete